MSLFKTTTCTKQQHEVAQWCAGALYRSMQEVAASAAVKFKLTPDDAERAMQPAALFATVLSITGGADCLSHEHTQFSNELLDLIARFDEWDRGPLKMNTKITFSEN